MARNNNERSEGPKCDQSGPSGNPFAAKMLRVTLIQGAEFVCTRFIHKHTRTQLGPQGVAKRILFRKSISRCHSTLAATGLRVDHACVQALELRTHQSHKLRIQDPSWIQEPRSWMPDRRSRIEDPGPWPHGFRILDPASSIQNPRSSILDPGPGSWIRDPGSTILDPGPAPPEIRYDLNAPQCSVHVRTQEDKPTRAAHDKN